MRRLILASGLIGVLTFASVVSAQEQRQEIVGPDWSASIGAGVWISNGESLWQHEFPVLVVPPVTGGSRLRFKDVDSNVATLDADLVLRRLFVVTVAGGIGTMDNGKFIDEDFASAFTFSRTRSSVDDGDLYFANLNVGVRVYQWRDFEGRHGFLDLLGGYQWWREEYEAFGASDELGFTGDIPPNVKALTHTWTWQSARIGGRASVPFPYGVNVRANVFFLPWSHVEVEDIHHLRTDLRQDPSAITEATGGFGWQAEAAIGYTFWKGFGIEAGYRYWDVEVDEGDVTIRAVSGTLPDLELKEARTRRGGFFANLYYRF